MRRKLYCLLPSVESARHAVTELEDAGLSRHYMHVLARRGTLPDDMPSAGLLQKSELPYALELGGGLGGLAGMLGGLLTILFPPQGLVVNGGATLLLTTLSGAVFGSLVSALIASSLPSHAQRVYQDRLLQGQVLLLVEIPTHRIKMTCDLIESYYPDAQISLTPLRAAPGKR